MKITMMFPGQGAQFVGMGLDFYNEYKEYEDLIRSASLVSGLDLKDILEDEEKLGDTKNAQIAIFTMSYGIASLLEKEGIHADHVLGLSLGEYGALTFAEVLKQEDTVKLLKRRSDLMQTASMEEKGFLAAVSFMEQEKVEEAVSSLDGVYVSNYNAPNQTVVGGKETLKEAFEEEIRLKGGKKITYLPVSGAFHTPMMEKAAREFGAYLKDFAFHKPGTSVLSNYKGDFYKEEDDFKKILEKHIHHPVKLTKCLEKLESKDEDILILLGPGKALASILKQNRIRGRIFSVNTTEEFRSTVKELQEEIHYGK